MMRFYEIGLTPNRTDAMSHYGVARDLHAFLSTNGLKSEFEKVSTALKWVLKENMVLN